jgi:undecaprenyl-diphosphatase
MAIETSVTHSLNHALIHHDALEDTVSWYASASAALFAVALVALLIAPRTRRPAVVAVIATPMALAVTAVLGALLPRTRPFAAHDGIHRFIAHAADPGFPSDHAAASFAIATAIFISSRRLGAALLAAAVLLAVSRVAAGVHWPTDVIAGGAVGAGAAIVAARIWRRVGPTVEPHLDRVTAHLPAAVR